MQRLIFSLVVVVGATAAIAAGATGAFFSDSETSLGNLFTAGQIDLKVDNESYYNGNACVDVNESPDIEEFEWVGTASFPIAGTACDTTWLPDDLNDGAETLHRFFNFTDVKPSDDGEDTISLEVQNDAWMCMAVSLTSNDDFSTNEPESHVDVAEDPENNWDGELAQNIEMFWWADDGDNVYEIDENILSGLGTVEDGVETLYDLATTSPFQVALADAQNNAWGESDGTPVPAGTSYIAKAWCFGAIDITPESEGDGGPLERGEGFNGGYECDGNDLGNITQTDRATLDVSFSAVQARHNDDFLCNPPTTGTITVRKEIVGEENDLTNPPSDETDFAPYTVDGNPIPYGVATPYAPGPHTVGETNTDPDYTASFSLDCSPNGVVNVIAGDDHECIITNTYAPQCVLTGANIVPNGGFETPEVSTAQNWNIFDSVAGGWTVEWRSDIPASFGGSTRPTPAHLELHEGVLGAAFEGDQYAELDSDWGGPTSGQTGEPASITVYQDIPTEVGATYEVRFNWAARPSTGAPENRIRVEWDGVIVHDTGNVGDANAGITWIAVGPIGVTATGATTRLQFTDMGVANSVGSFLDNVQVVKTSCGPGGPNSPVASPAQTGQSSLFLESFGTGGDDNDVPSWDESSGGGAAGDTRAENGTGTGEGPVSPNGGRYALINDNGWICRSVNATQLHTMQLDYYWMGDNDAEDGESATVQYATGGTCASPTGVTTLATHELDDGADGGAAWASNGGLALPASLNGTTFLLRFVNGNQSVDDEDFRVDGVTVSGIATN